MLWARNPGGEITDLRPLTDRTLSRPFRASETLTGTPPLLPLGAIVCFPLLTTNASPGAAAAILVPILFPTLDTLDPPLSRDAVDAEELIIDVPFLPQPAIGDVGALLLEPELMLPGVGDVMEPKRSPCLAASLLICFSTTLRERAPRAAMTRNLRGCDFCAKIIVKTISGALIFGEED
jgi:hypothetical protein